VKDFLQRIENLSSKHLVLLALDQQKRLEKLERAQQEPVAIVGIGCRFPGGVHGPDAFWQLLAESRDAITEIPGDRWDVDSLYDLDPEAPGRIATRSGGFLCDVDKFDAPFFGISRREAINMDPQQRLLLETTWEALEHAGVSPKDIAGSQTGFFFGISTADYCQLLFQGGYGGIDPYTATGGAHSIAAGRVAYILGTHGPAIVVDTSCSSSLVALHLAGQSLRTGECDLALVGGVNLILSPESTIALSKAHMLSPDGRSKAFDAAADGFARAEGCGVVAIKLLSRAIADRDNIWAVMRGSAVNHDGHSSGLTAPNGAAQERLIRQALQAAGIKAPDIQYVEAHGTGTALGDPIEAHALAAVLGAGRDVRNPLYVGSVKTNVGHLEAAAGIAGVIKTALSLRNGIIPPSLHFSQLNPHIDLNGVPFVVAAAMTEWPSVQRRMAGVSSFGFSGTNAHVILEAPPGYNPAIAVPDANHVLVISARTPTALRTLASHYAEYLASTPDVSLRDVCYTAHVGRSRFEHVLALPAMSLKELRGKLARVAAGDDVPGVEIPSAPPPANKIALPTYPFEGQHYWVETRRPQPPPEQSDVDFYKLSWEKKPVSSEVTRPAAPPGTVRAIAGRVAEQYDSLSLEHGFDRYGELRPELDRLTFEQITRALAECGWRPACGDTIGADDLVERFGVQPRYLRLLARMLEILGEEGMLERVGGRWRVLRTPASTDSHTEFLLLQAAYPQFRGELEMLRRSSSQLAEVLQGRLDPLNVLFPGGAFDTAEAIYEKSAGSRVFQTLVQQTVAQLIEALPADRPIRILEVGGGTGGTASYVARILPSTRTEYVFTDISPLFATRGAEKFREYPFFRYEVLDIERDPIAQGFAEQSFDVVIAANCLHATGDLRASLAHVAHLLAPGGMLVLLESTLPERWVDITFGLTDGWWKFTDSGLRGDYPLLSKSGWQKLLTETGFSEITLLPPDIHSQQALLIARAPAANREKKRNWLLISDASGFARQLAATLTERGERVVVICGGDPLPVDQAAWRGIVDLSSLDVPAAEDMTDVSWDNVHHLGCERVLALTSLLIETGGRLWVATRGAQCVGGESMSSAVASAPVWGLGRTIALEHPDIWGGLVDLDPAASAENQAGLLVDALTAADGEDQIAFRGGVCHVARLKRSGRPAQVAPRFEPHASYLITGGLGGLGLVVARWMAEQGAHRLILVGRGGIERPEQAAAINRIEQLGASVRTVRADIADPETTAQLFDSIAAEEPPLKGVIHAAAALSRDNVREMSPDVLREVLRPKVLGTWLLHRRTRHLALDFFCLFSSAASLLGASGLAHYAAANQFLDALAKYRQGQGLPALAIEWGAWDEMRNSSEKQRQESRSRGLLPMPASRALAALGDLLHSRESCVVVAAIKWNTLRAVFEARRKQPLLYGIEMPAVKAEAASVNEPQWQRLPAPAREAWIANVVWEEICRVLRIDDGAPIEFDRGFFEMGMDSLVSVELKNRLEARMGRSVPATLTFNFPTVRTLSSYLSKELTASSMAAANGTDALSNGAGKIEPDDEEVANLLASKLKSLITRKGSDSI
jgi:acyl transferase domain-containing protein/acyl carrier protein/protein-L-isoaspartate O-methyltransferase